MKTSAVSSFEYLSECVALNQFTSLERQKQVLPTKTERWQLLTNLYNYWQLQCMEDHRKLNVINQDIWLQQNDDYNQWCQ